MSKTTFHIIFMFIILALLQVVVFNRICLFGVAVPFVFIYLFVKLPVNLNLKWVFTIGFLMGLIIDVFSNTQGMNALACTILCALRLPTLRLYFPREEEMVYPVPSSRTLGSGVFMKYVLTMTLCYCALFFVIESFTFFNPLRLVVKTIASTALTFLVIIAIDSLTSRSREKRL
ncbi:MAG: rod shape-determining protein MreD [Muribaculaceae bacterium]|nr:rod shape-determining protein MreD [Muribaculaceae bacterium]